MISPLKAAETLIVTYEYLFYLPLSDRLRPPARRKARGLLSGSSTQSNTGHWLRPKILDTTDSLQQQTTREPYTPYRI
jgi:hypothetical protein